MLYSSFVNALYAPLLATPTTEKYFNWFLIASGAIAVVGVAVELYWGKRRKRALDRHKKE